MCRHAAGAEAKVRWVGVDNAALRATTIERLLIKFAAAPTGAPVSMAAGQSERYR
jgi:hypothetical protein